MASLLKYPTWQESVLQAIVETEPGQQPDKIRVAQAAISKRVEALQSTKWDADEYRALNDAADRLNHLKRN